VLSPSSATIGFMPGQVWPPFSISIMHSEVAISQIMSMEVLVGAPDHATQLQWVSFLALFQMVELEDALCRDAIQLRRVHRLKLPDALIWASARAFGADLVTRNTKDFRQGTRGIRLPYQR
jgi:predicted nucleic acid-binding protein